MDGTLAPSRWQSIRGQQVLLQRWDDGYTAFHAGSGDTYLLNHLTGEVLSCLLQQPLSCDALAQRVLGENGAKLDSDSLEIIQSAIDDLRRAHMIEPLAP